MINLDTYSQTNGTDEALWEAYRRHDKTAVMDYLFRRSLVGIGPSQSFARLAIRAARKEIGLRKAHTADTASPG